MKLIGKTRPGASVFELVANTKRVARYTFPVACRVPKLSIYVDGLGSGTGDQVVRGIIYDSGGLLVAMGDEVTVEEGQAAGWIDLPFTGWEGGVEVLAAQYDLGVIGGVATNSVRVYGDDPGSNALTGALALTMSGNEITDLTRLAGAVGDGRGYVQVTNLLYQSVGHDPLSSISALGGTGATVTALGGGKYRLFGGTGAQVTFRMLFTDGIVQVGSPLTGSAFYENVTGAVEVDVEDQTSVNLAAGSSGRVISHAIHRTPTTTYRFMDFAVNAGASIDVWGAQIEYGYVAHDYVASASAQTVREVVVNLASNGNLEADTSGWIAFGGTATIARSTAQAKYGAASLLVTPSAAGTGAQLLSVPQAYAGVPVTASAWVFAPVGLTVTMSVSDSLNTVLATPTVVGNGAWQRVSVSVTPTAGSAGVYVRYVGSAATPFYLDGVQVEYGSTLHDFIDGQTYVPLDGTTGLWEATTNLFSNSDFETNVNGWLYAGSPNTIGGVARDTTVSRFGSASLRAFGVPTQAMTVSGNEITDATRAAAVQGDGRGYEYVFNLCQNAGFETWATGIPTNYTVGANATVTQQTASPMFGTNYARFTSSVASNVSADALNFALPAALVANVSYVVSFWARRVSGTGALNLAIDSVGSTVATTSDTSGQWIRVTAPFTGAASASGRWFLGTAGDTWEIDGFQIETGSVAHDFVNTGTGAGGGAIQGPLVTNLILNGGFEKDATGTSSWGTAGTVITRSTTIFKDGLGSGKIVTTGVASQGVALLSSAPSGRATVVGGQAYTFSAWLRGDLGGEHVVLQLAWYDINGTSLSSSTSATLTLGTAFAQFTLTASAPSNAAFAYIVVAATAASVTTYYVDDAQCEAGIIANAFVNTTTAMCASAVAVADGSTGIWEAATNLMPNGGMETNIANIGVAGLNPPGGPFPSTPVAGTGTGLTGTFIYKCTDYVSNVNGNFESTSVAASSSVTVANKDIVVTLPPVGNVDVTGRKLYRSSDGGTTWKIVASIPGVGVGATYDDTTPDGSLTTQAPPTSPTGLATATRVTTGGKFGSACLQVGLPGSVAGEGAFGSTNGSLARAAGSLVIGSGWIKGAPGTQLQVWMRNNNTDTSASDSSKNTVVLDGTWQRFSTPAWSVQTGKTADSYSVMFRTNVLTLGVFWLDGIQVEEKGYVTPYVHTNGAAATRAAARVQSFAAQGLMGATTGWFTARIRMGFPSSELAAATLTESVRLFEWQVDANNRIVGVLNSAAAFSLTRTNGGVGSGAGTAAQTWNTGDYFTIGVKWNSTNVFVSINGGAYISVANTNIPSLGSITSFDVGSDGGGGGWLNGDVIWAIGGTAQLFGDTRNIPTDADAATLGARGNTDPLDTTVPAAGVNFVLPMSTSAYTIYRQAYPFIRNSGFAATSGVKYAASAWVLMPAGITGSITLFRADFTTQLGTASFVGTGFWQRIQVAGTAAATETIYLFVQSSQPFSGGSFWMDGAQLEINGVATPFTPSSRPAGLVEAPVGLLSTTQGWVAMRMRLGYVGANSTGRTAFALDDGTTNNRIALVWVGGWASRRVVGGVGGLTASVADAFNADDERLVILRWDAGNIAISVNGAPFVSVANGQSGFVPTAFGLGSDPASLPIGANVAWSTGGMGVPADADAAALYALGDTVPTWAQVPAQPTFLWNGATVNYIVSQSGRTNVDTYSDGASNPFGSSTPLDFDMSVYATYTNLAQQVPSETELYYARMPFDRAQEVLNTHKTDANVLFEAKCGWHGTKIDKETGSFVIVDGSGPLAALVGERLKVTITGSGLDERIVYAYCHTYGDLDADLSVTRRLFLALAVPGDDPADVIVEVVS